MAEGGRQSVILLPGLDASEPPLASSDRLPSDVSSFGFGSCSLNGES